MINFFSDHVVQLPLRFEFLGMTGLLPDMIKKEWKVSCQSYQSMDSAEYVANFILDFHGEHNGFGSVRLSYYDLMRAENLIRTLTNIEIPLKVCHRGQFQIYPTSDMQMYQTPWMPANGFVTTQVLTQNGPMNGRINFSDLVRFHDPDLNSGLILPEQDVDEILDIILKKQESKQDEIREKKRLNEKKSILWTPEQEKGKLIAI